MDYIVDLILGFLCQPAERQGQILVKREGIEEGCILEEIAKLSSERDDSPCSPMPTTLS